MKHTRIVALVLLVVLIVISLIAPMLAFAISPSTAADIKNNISNTEQHVSDDMAQIRLHETDTLNSKTDIERVGENDNLLFIGVSGLRMEDIVAQLKYNKNKNFTHLKKFIENSALANNIVRSTFGATCTADGWLALNTGKRISDVYRGGVGVCVDLAFPYDSGRLHDWNAYKYSESVNNYHAKLGTLREQLGDIKAKSIGLGAAIALANKDGKVTNFMDANASSHVFAKDIVQALEENKLVMVDAGQIRPYRSINPRWYDVDSDDIAKETGSIDNKQYEQEAMLKIGGENYINTPLSTETESLLERLDIVLSYQSEKQNIILVSLADSGKVPHLQLAAFKGPVFKHKGFIESSSTRHEALIQNEDIYKKILSLLGIGEFEVLKTTYSSLPTFREQDLVAENPQFYKGSKANVLIDRAVHADMIKRTAPKFLIFMVTVTAILFLLVALCVNKHLIDFISKCIGKDLVPFISSVSFWRVLRFVSITVACIPISGLLYNLLPWWRYPYQEILTILVSTFTAMLIACICSIGKVKESLVLPTIIVSLIHIIALSVDPLIGNQLLLDSVLGSQSILGARMYGFGNIMFALFATACMMFAACICQYLVGKSSKFWIVTVVVVTMVYATVIDGSPAFGADFGGPPAIIPGFIVLLLILTGVKLGWKRILGVFVFTGFVVCAIAIFDWCRPVSHRTHLGNFVQIILDGGLWDVVYRKIGANVNMLTSPLLVIAIGGVLLISYIIFLPRFAKRSGKEIVDHKWLTSDFGENSFESNISVFKPMLVGLAVMLFIGGSMNDSGIVIPGNAIVLAVPMCLSIWFTWIINIKMQNLKTMCNN